MGKELAASFAQGMRADDKLYVCDPVYFGGTVDRSIGSEALVADIVAGGANAVHMTTRANRSEEHTSELQSLMRISYAVFCLKKKKQKNTKATSSTNILNSYLLLTTRQK